MNFGALRSAPGMSPGSCWPDARAAAAVDPLSRGAPNAAGVCASACAGACAQRCAFHVGAGTVRCSGRSGLRELSEGPGLWKSMEVRVPGAGRLPYLGRGVGVILNANPSAGSSPGGCGSPCANRARPVGSCACCTSSSVGWRVCFLRGANAWTPVFTGCARPFVASVNDSALGALAWLPASYAAARAHWWLGPWQAPAFLAYRQCLIVVCPLRWSAVSLDAVAHDG